MSLEEERQRIEGLGGTLRFHAGLFDSFPFRADVSFPKGSATIFHSEWGRTKDDAASKARDWLERMAR